MLLLAFNMKGIGFRMLVSRALELLRRRQRDARLSNEVELHLDQLAEMYAARGMSPEAARLAARRAFGGVDQIKERYRDQRGLPFLDAVVQDVRFAARLLVKSPSFTMAAVLALSLGIAVNTIIFTIAYGMNFRALPVADAERVMHLDTQQLDGRRDRMAVSYADFLDWQRQTQTFSSLAAYAAAVANVGDGQRPADRLGAFYISHNAFRLLRVQPSLGRDFDENDDRVAASPVVILGHGPWIDRYGGDPAIVGKTVRISGTPTTVIGVMPPGFQFPVRADLWLPLRLMPEVTSQTRDRRSLMVFGRLHDDVSIEQARAEMSTIAGALASQYPATNRAVGATVAPFTERYMGRLVDSPVPMMLAAALFVLLIACANVANLLLARAAHRSREIALRVSLGASRGRIARQLTVESLMLSAISAAFAWAVTVAAMHLFTAETSDMNLPYWIHFGFDGRVFSYLVAVCVVTALLFGMAPIWTLCQTRTADMLKEGGRGVAGGRRTRRWTGALIVGEIALTVMLLAGAGLLIRSAAALADADRIVDTGNLLVASLALPAEKYRTPDERREFYRRLQERFDAMATIVSATVGSTRPFADATGRQLLFEGETAADRGPTVQAVTAGRRYFETLGLPILRGRALEPGDAAPGQEAVVVNEQFADQYSPNRNPIGQRIRLIESLSAGTTNTSPWLTIVGVSPSVRQRPMGDVAPVVYLPLDSQTGTNVSVIARGYAGPAAVGGVLRDETHAIDPDVALYNVMPLERLSELSRWNHRVISLVLSVFAAIAMLLAAIGLFSVTAYSVSQRTSEVGVRMALGAQRAHVSWMFMKSMMFRLAIGLTIGLAGALAVGRVLGGLLRRTGPFDPMTFALVATILIATSLVASLLPVRRALRLDPAVTLRHD